MRAVCLVLLILTSVAAVGHAEPVTFRFKSEVAVGDKPTLEVTAVEAVRDIKIALERDDGKHFALAHPGLAKGQHATLAIGDGAAGKASYKATVALQIVGGAAWSDHLTFDTAVRAPIKVTYDIDHLDLDKHVLQVKTSRAVDTAELVALGEDGAELGKGTATWKTEPANAWMTIGWTQPAGARVMKLKLRVVAGDGAAVAVELVPWSVEVAHEDVNFRTDSAVIDPGEDTKLDASLVKIQEVVARSAKVMPARLYVAGHTDTVGPSDKNRTLSLARARAIGSYFRKHGLAIPIAIAGYGEDVLKVPTAQDKDEPANRRADYVLGPAAGQPPFKGPYLKAHAQWRELP